MVRGRLTKVQTITRPDHVLPDVWTKIGKAAHKREEQEWANEEPKFDNARRMSGIYFIDPEDEKYKESIKNAMRKLEVHMAAGTAVQKRRQKARRAHRNCREAQCTQQGSKKRRMLQKWNLKDPQGNESNHLYLKDHKDHIAGKGYNSMNHYNLAHKFIPLPQAVNIPNAQAVMDKEWKKLEKIQAWQLDKVKSNMEVMLEAQRQKNKVHFASSVDLCHLKNAELEPTFQKYKGRVVLRGDIVKYRLWNLCSFY